MDLNLEWLAAAFTREGYICGMDVLLPVYLSLRLRKPLLIEGAPGVGKTEVGKVLARVLGAELIRLQCYEGLDEQKALYEWNYQRQLLRIQLSRSAGATADTGGAGGGGGAGGEPDQDIRERELFSEEYLLMRPLLRAIRSPVRPVLLIDEVDKVDEAFEAFLFELLSDFQVSIPELGTLTAENVPVVVLTSNSERDLSDGLKRRCVYLYIDFPTPEREVEIILARSPDVPLSLATEIARTMHFLRTGLDLRKKPSIAETLDWARALLTLGVGELDGETVSSTAGLVLKNRDDLQALSKELDAHGVERLLRG